MSFKKKTETALLDLTVIPVSAFTNAAGHRLTSEENQEANRALPCILAEYHPGQPWRTNALGENIGCESGLLTLTLWSKADKTTAEDSPAPEAEHAANLVLLRNVLQVSGIAALLSAAVADFTIFSAQAAPPPSTAPQDRCFIGGFAWQIRGCETDCA